MKKSTVLKAVIKNWQKMYIIFEHCICRIGIGPLNFEANVLSDACIADNIIFLQ